MASPKKILITGASGLIGSELTKKLIALGHSVSHVGRSRKNGPVPSFVWNIHEPYCDPQALEGVDTIIHLAGAGVAEKRWTESRKREILESRTKSTRLLYKTLQENKNNVRAVISASAIGYYGFEHPERVFYEDSPIGKDFLATVVRAWENEIDKLSGLSLRVVKIRIGVVLSRDGGAMKEMSKPVKLFVGSPLGNGDQYVSWIHIEDLCNIFMKALDDNNMTGAYNATAPIPVTNRELTRAIANALRRPMFMPAVPGWILKVLLGEMANLVTNGSRVSSQKIEEAGFRFTFTNVQSAVDDLLK